MKLLCKLLGHLWREPTDLEVVAIYAKRWVHVERCCDRCGQYRGFW